MENIDYNYQNEAVERVLNLLKIQPKAILLAAVTGSGKSYMAKDVIVSYTKSNPQDKVVFLAHGQNVLKKQFIEILNDTITNEFEYGSLGEDKQVSVGLPHYFNTKKVDQIDLLIIDEAHEYYLADMEQSIIKKYNPKNILLLTGSPGKFNKDRGIKCVYVMNRKLDCQVDLDMVKINSLATKDLIETSLVMAKNKCAKVNQPIDKIMIVCKDIMQAKIAKGCMEKRGFKSALSTNDNDESGNQIFMFKNQEECKCLIVVNRGILGFNEGRINVLIDLKGSNNLDKVNQYFSRLLRNHPLGYDKFFIRASNNKSWNKDVQLLHDIIGLMTEKNFKNYII